MQLETLLEPVRDIAREAGRAIMDVYTKADHEVVKKDDQSPLTAADLAAHDIIVAGLRKLDPAIPVLSEEGADTPWSERSSWTRYWLVDPLDGTKEFVRRNGEFTVNIALIAEGVPVLGVVYAPVLDWLYSGVRGLGACKQVGEVGGEVGGDEVGGDTHSQGQVGGDTHFEVVQEVGAGVGGGTHSQVGGDTHSICCQSIREGQPSLRVVASRSHRGPELDSWLEAMQERFSDIELVSMGSSLKICLVAEGRADIYPRLAPTCEWDTAAAQAVLEAAGGVLLDAQGHPLRYNCKDVLLNPHFYALGDPGFEFRAA